MGSERCLAARAAATLPRMICVALAIFAGIMMAPPAGSGALQTGTESPDFPAILAKHGNHLAAVTSDAEALALFSFRLGLELDLKDSLSALARQQQAGKATPPPNSPELANQVIRLTAELAAWQLSAAIKQTADSGDDAALQAILQQSNVQQSWLLGGEGRQPLRKAAALAAVIVSVQSVTSEPDSSAAYTDYATFLDRTYPRLTGSDASWLALAERDGPAGTRQRLMEYWESPGQSDAGKEQLAARYFGTRIRPVLAAQSTALAIRAEAEAEQGARDAWHRLRTWRERVKEFKGLTRLCGTWSWTIHNHQNHQEHKMVMSFGPPDEPEASAPRPAKIVILGDAVYLRWEFQEGGYQEDSLLFAGEGQRLEGTFVNSAGAWGAITGKRTAPCRR